MGRLRSTASVVVVVLAATGHAQLADDLSPNPTLEDGGVQVESPRCAETDVSSIAGILQDLWDAITWWAGDGDSDESSVVAGAEAVALQPPADAAVQRPPDEVIPADRLFFDDFENTINDGGAHGWTRIWALDCQWNPGDYEQEIRNSSRFHYSSRYARFGSQSLRVECRQHDRVTDSDKLGGNERAEISRRYHYQNDGEGGHGDERWYGVSVLLPDDMPAIPSGAAAIITQFLKENNRDAPYPNPTIDVRVKQRPGGALFLEVYNRQQTGNDGTNWTTALTDIGDLEREQWADLAFHIRWATDNTGFWEVWRDGVLRASRYDTPTLPGAEHWTFQKIGIYSWNIAATRYVHYDGYWMGKTAPAYAAPVPVNRMLQDALESAVGAPIEVIVEGLR